MLRKADPCEAASLTPNRPFINPAKLFKRGKKLREWHRIQSRCSRNSACHARHALRLVRPKRGCWLVIFLATIPVPFPNLLSPPGLDGLDD